MTINRNDDYDKLARILYPSIEASGNVYFGQTRKLTMDEILGKNDLNFESHVESFKVYNNENDHSLGYHYDSYFCWKLGPLKSSIKISNDNLIDHYAVNASTFPEYTLGLEYIGDPESAETPGEHGYLRSVFLLKYHLDTVNESTSEVVNSGEFTTYSKSFNPVLVSICYTSGVSPIDIEDSNIADRNFFVDLENKLLYIKLSNYNYNVPSLNISQSEIETPLTISTTASDCILDFTLRGYSDAYNSYEYSINEGNWLSFYPIINGDMVEYYNYSGSERVLIPQNGNIRIRCSNRAIDEFSMTTHIVIDVYEGATLSGNVNSLVNTDFTTIDSVGPYEFYGLFSGSNATNFDGIPVLPATKLDVHCYENMFAGTSITEPPILPATELAEYCYSGMFTNCEYLTKTPILLASKLERFCYQDMFSYCSSLSEIHCYAYEFAKNSTRDWISDTPYYMIPGVLYINPCATWEYDSDSGLPSWTNVNQKSISFNTRNNTLNHTYRANEVIVSGSDSAINGGGKLSDSTFDMIKYNPYVDDTTESREPDTYNRDGSFNQEIWGYKCFNSPISFRKGIYGECASLTTYFENEFLADSTLYKGSSLNCWNKYNGEDFSARCIVQSAVSDYHTKSSASLVAQTTQTSGSIIVTSEDDDSEIHLNANTIFGKIPIIENNEDLTSSPFALIPVGSILILQLAGNSGYYVWPGVAIRYSSSIRFRLEKNINTEEPTPIEVVMYKFSISDTNGTNGDWVDPQNYTNACFVALSHGAVISGNAQPLSANAFYAVRIK